MRMQKRHTMVMTYQSCLKYTQLKVKTAFALDSLSASFFYMLLRRDKPSGTTIITPWYPNSVSLGHTKQESKANM